MLNSNLGNVLNQIVNFARTAIFEQGELNQLTNWAFDIAVNNVHEMEYSEINVTFPVGFNPDKTTINNTRTYNKEQLLLKYQFLAFNQLALNSLMQLVTIVEAMLSDIVRVVVARYPQKLGAKRNISIQSILEATSLEEVHLRATDALLNDLSYKSPTELAESMKQLLSLNLLECPAFHSYVEIKATRDIFVHNRGIANDVYMRKAGSHARVKPHMSLPVNTHYFLESYEHCIQVTEWLEEQLHEHWHSSEYEHRKTPQPELPLTIPKITETVIKNHESLSTPPDVQSATPRLESP
ncbi:MAG TPA: hypothetical protein VNQ90_14470 [Chthoniobacteraceae bacterium]|nr:hypothetical protein [Chthoniobacteraceae bacterium]